VEIWWILVVWFVLCTWWWACVWLKLSNSSLQVRLAGIEVWCYRWGWPIWELCFPRMGTARKASRTKWRPATRCQREYHKWVPWGLKVPCRWATPPSSASCRSLSATPCRSRSLPTWQLHCGRGYWWVSDPCAGCFLSVVLRRRL
jgi:hypothetical protein